MLWKTHSLCDTAVQKYRPSAIPVPPESTFLEWLICTCLAESSAFLCDSSRCLRWPPAVNLAHQLWKPPLKPTGTSEATFEGLRCEVGQWQAKRDEDMECVSGSAAAPQHPSRWVLLFSLIFSFSLACEDTCHMSGNVGPAGCNQILPICNLITYYLTTILAKSVHISEVQKYDVDANSAF